MAGGKYAAYQRLQPLQGDVTNDLLNAEDQEFKHRAEQRLIKDRTKADIDAIAKNKKLADEEYANNFKKAYIKPTGYKSHDEPLVKILQGEGGILDQWDQTLTALKKDPRNQKLLIRKLNLEESIDRLKGLRDGVVARGQNLKKGIADKTLSEGLNKDAIANYNALINDYQYDFKISDNGTIVVENKAYDPDGDGIPNELTLDDLHNPEKMLLKPRFNGKGWITGMKKLYGKKTKKTDANFVEHEVIGFDMSKLDALNKDVAAEFGSDLETMTVAAESYIADFLKIPLGEVTEDQFKDIKSDFATRFMNSYESTDKTDVDNSARNTAIKNRKDAEGDDGANGISFIEHKQYGEGDDAVANRWSFNKPYVVKGTNKSDRPKTLTEIRYDQANGEVVLIGKEYLGKETTSAVKADESESTTPNNSPYGNDSESNTNKTTTTKNQDEWGPVTITDKSEVTSILSKVMGLGSYAEIVKHLRSNEELKEGTKETTKKTIKGF